MGTDLDESESAQRDVTRDVLSDEDLSRSGLRRDARRDVDRPAEVVALDRRSWAPAFTPTCAGGRPAGWTRSTISSDAITPSLGSLKWTMRP